MKGVLKLIDISSPIEGMQVVWQNSVCIIGKNQGFGIINLEGSNEDLWAGDLRQIVVEHEEEERFDPKEITSKFFPSKIRKPLSLHPDDWQEALSKIGEEVEFKIDPCTPKGMKYGQEQYSSILQQTYGESAKLIHPTPVTYTEEEVEELLMNFANSVNINNYKSSLTKGAIASAWWNKNKKK